MIILGAGMAGCLAGVLDPKAIILEAAPEPTTTHRAVLRFREDKISKVTGIPFRPVMVRKAIWLDGQEVMPTPRVCNLYSQKITGKILDRSIRSIESVQRFIAPDDFHLQLAEQCKARIKYNSPVEAISKKHLRVGNGGIGLIERAPDESILSTIPMPTLMLLLGIGHHEKFDFQPITVTRYKIPGADVFQTIYFPASETPVYRATMTGDDLIIESVANISIPLAVCAAFGISYSQLQPISENVQKYGKIAPIDDRMRKHMMFTASADFRVYSLGRFACWRNILLDDVYEDFFKVKRMINTTTHYDHKLEALT